MRLLLLIFVNFCYMSNNLETGKYIAETRQDYKKYINRHEWYFNILHLVMGEFATASVVGKVEYQTAKVKNSIAFNQTFINNIYPNFFYFVEVSYIAFTNLVLHESITTFVRSFLLCTIPFSSGCTIEYISIFYVVYPTYCELVYCTYRCIIYNVQYYALFILFLP